MLAHRASDAPRPPEGGLAALPLYTIACGVFSFVMYDVSDLRR